MGTEFELKLSPVTPFDGDALEGLLGLGPARQQRLRAIYFDTPSHHLAKLGYALRIRKEGRDHIQTVKAGGGGPFARQEWEQRVQGTMPVVQAGSPVAEALGETAATLMPMFEVITDRQTWLITDSDADIEMVVDRCVATANEESLPFVEIELELKRGKPDAVFALARRIGRLTPVRLGMLAKSDRARRLVQPPEGAEKARLIKLTDAHSAGEACQLIVQDCLRHYRDNEERLDTDDNAAALHQARVALRRLRSALVVFRPIADGKALRRFADDLRWLAEQLGRARDIDVLLKHGWDKKALARLNDARDLAYAHARHAMHSQLARELMLDLAEWVTVGKWTRRHRTLRSEKAKDFAARAINHLHIKLAAHRDAVGGEGAHEAVHELRKIIKKLRSTVEFFAMLFDKGKLRKARIRYLAALEELQDVLGDYNDRVMMPRLLTTLGIETEDKQEAGDDTLSLAQAKHALRQIEEADRFW